MIDFSHDPEVTDALKQWRGREVFPTDFSSADLRGLSRELRERSVFSARTTNADYLEHVAGIVDDMLSGKINLATGRWELMKRLKEIGYDPEVGFPGEFGVVPPAERGSLRDLSSERRLDLMLETNMRMAANYGRVVAGNGDYALYAYPAWELVRLYIRAVPRGTPESRSVGWQRRWSAAGESVGWEGCVDGGSSIVDGSDSDPQSTTLNPRSTPSGRMVALKDSPIWQALGDGDGGFQDTLGNPYPPFAFQSGMAWKAVDRKECVALGLIGGEDSPAPMKAQLSPGAQEVNAAYDRLSPDLQEALRRELEEAA